MQIMVRAGVPMHARSCSAPGRTEAIEAIRVLRDQIHATILKVSADAVARDPPAAATDGAGAPTALVTCYF